MNDEEERYFKMFEATLATMLENKSVWENNQNIVDCVETLKLIVKKLINLTSGKYDSPKGLTAEKLKSRKRLIKMVFAMKQSLMLYYKNNSMENEAKLLEFAISKLNRMTEDSFYLLAGSISQRAIDLALGIIPMGITQIQIDDLAAEVLKFGAILPKIELAIQKKESDNAHTTEWIDECRIMLNESLNVAVSIYAEANPDFCKKYLLARRLLKKPGKHKTYQYMVSGMVTDSITGEPITGILVEIGAKKILATTNSKGIYQKNIYKKDADFIRFSLPDVYDEKIESLDKKPVKNKITLNVELTKTGYKPSSYPSWT